MSSIETQLDPIGEPALPHSISLFNLIADVPVVVIEPSTLIPP